jgi:hypothetical protein
MTVKDETIRDNNRETQLRNGRTVYIYDHVRFGCAEFKSRPKKVTPAGHYEKRLAPTTKYIFVGGEKPSGIPGAFVVSEEEAKGIESTRT